MAGRRRNDQLFQMRKARAAASYKRKEARKAPYDRVLIVCEGEKTEPVYLAELKEELKLNSANIEIVPNTLGSAPISVVRQALRKFAKEKDYNRVYCVFDKDIHPSYSAALHMIKEKTQATKGNCPIFAVVSVPCFEFWLLLHFRYTTRPYQAKNGSICESVITDLKKFLPDYEKGGKNIFHKTKSLLPQAISNAKKVLHHCETGETDMPSTRMHELVEYLQQLKKP